MSDTRPLYCPACGQHHEIPMDTPTNKKARCSICSTIFQVPPPLLQSIDDITAAHQFNIQELPTDLRAEIGIIIDEDMPIPEPKHVRSNQFKDTQEILRKALDLGPNGEPRCNTGVKIISVANLPSDDDEATDTED